MASLSATTSISSAPPNPALPELSYLLGEGSFGSVYKGRILPSRKVVAVKVIPIAMGDEETEKALQEIDILSACSSQYIVEYYECIIHNPGGPSSHSMAMGEMWILMEYCRGGSISDILTRLSGQTPALAFDEDIIQAVCASVALGLQYLHSNSMVHRDIKAGNVLVTNGGMVKLADFGVSATISNTMSKRKTVVGSPYWMAPEVIKESEYDGKADVWSLGITCIEMAESAPPHANLHPLRAIFLIPQKPPPTLADPDRWSPAMIDFTRVCLTKDTSQRPDSSALSSHPFIRQDVSSLRAREAGLPAIRNLLARLSSGKAAADAAAASAAQPSVSEVSEQELFRQHLHGDNDGETTPIEQSSFVVRDAGRKPNVAESAVQYFKGSDEGLDDEQETISNASPSTSPSISKKTRASRSPTTPGDIIDLVGRNLTRFKDRLRGQHHQVKSTPQKFQQVDLMRELFDAFAGEQASTIQSELQDDIVLQRQLAKLTRKLETEMAGLKVSYELAKQQLVVEAQLRNSLPFDASELMRQAAKRAGVNKSER
jgi:serine/threonine protein kinase